MRRLPSSSTKLANLANLSLEMQIEVDLNLEANEFLVSEWLQSWHEIGIELSAERSIGGLLWAVQSREKAVAFNTEPPAIPSSTAPALPCRVLFLLPKGSESLTGASYSLLLKMVTAMGLDSDSVAIGPIEHPNHATSFAEQPKPLGVVAPSVAVFLGLEAPQSPSDATLGSRWSTLSLESGDVPVLETFSLNALLAQPQLKRSVWDGLQLVMQKISR